MDVRLKLIYTCALLTQLSFPAHAAISSVLNGASYQPVVAPNSWAVAFGTMLAPNTASATLTATGQWPTTLAGITMQVDGQPAELFYASPTQINFLIPGGTTLGALSVTITNVQTGATQSSTVDVQNTAPGIFSSNSSGSGAGAILNGVTYAGPPFLVVTPQTSVSDQRTRLAVYCTGLRYAGNPTQDPTVTNVMSSVIAHGMDTSGNQYNFTVEYAGAAPGYIGLDQVNIVLPAQLDGAGLVSLTFTVANFTSNTVTFLVNSLPASSIALASLSLSTNETTGGNMVTGTLSLNGLAPSTGFPVTLRTSLPTVTLPSVVAIPQGQNSATFTIDTPSTSATQTATISASAVSTTLTATLQIDSATLAQLSSFTVSSSNVQGGTEITGTIGLTNAAPLGGAVVQIASDNAAVQPPASVTVPANSTTNTFKIPTSTVTAPQTATLTATLGSTTQTAQVTVVPALQFTLANTSVTGGASVTATITLGTVAPSIGANITISSNALSVAQATAGTMTIPAGETTATVAIETFTVTSARTVILTASDTLAGISQTATLTVNPVTAGQLQGVTVSQVQVPGGTSITGTITLSGPAPLTGVLVTLRSSNTLGASVPFSVTVPQGQTTATFNVTTNKVATTQTVTITATSGIITETATLTVTP